MAKQEVLQCPLCHGHSQVSLSELREFTKSGAFQRTVEKLLAAAASTSEVLQPASATKDVPSHRDFQKEVHSWNPQLPIWRRSPKE
jgi:hypothetical protein